MLIRRELSRSILEVLQRFDEPVPASKIGEAVGHNSIKVALEIATHLKPLVHVYRNVDHTVCGVGRKIHLYELKSGAVFQ